jgi:terminase, large subunit
VPAWALCLVLTADIQEHGIWYEIRAHAERQTAGVRYGYLAKGLTAEAGSAGLAGDFAALAEILAASYQTAGGEAYQVRFGLVDSGYRTGEVYAFCRQAGRLAPSKGAESKRVPISYAKIDTMPGTGKLIPGGVQLVHFDATFFKDELANILQVKPGDPGYWALHGETGEDYARQYTSEFRNEETGLWEQKGSQPNHLWDCGVLQLVARRVLETQGLLARLARERQEKEQPAPARRPGQPQQPTGVKLW